MEEKREWKINEILTRKRMKEKMKNKWNTEKKKRMKERRGKGIQKRRKE